MQLLPDLNRVQDPIEQDPAGLEPGLLSVFRLVMGLQLVLTCVGLAGFSVRRGDLPPGPALFQVVWLCAVVAYLAWPELRLRLGRAYLPVVLTAISIFAVLDRALFIQSRDIQILIAESDHVIAGSSWRLFALLFVPLVMIAWQYDFRRILLFAAGVTLLDLLAGFAVLNGVNTPLWLDLLGTAAARIVAFTLIGYVIFRMIDAQRTQRYKLSDANARLTQYATALEQLTTSRERNRLARELHDTLAHTLSAVSVQLEAVDSAWDSAPEKARELLHKSLSQTRSGLVETRRALHDLRASPLEDLGLALAVRNLAESTAARMGVEIQISMPRPVENIPPAIEQGVYRVAQEALENVARHSGASSLRIALAHESDMLALTIVDDGGGFDEDVVAANGHFGLQGMQERAEMMGARLTVLSAEGNGTVVQLVVPAPQSLQP